MKTKMYNIRTVIILSLFVVSIVATRSYQTIEGNSINIKCRATESEDVDVFWTKDNITDIHEQGANLSFTNISREDAGEYVCNSAEAPEASDPEQKGGTGKVNSRVESVKVDVMYPARIANFSVEPAIPTENEPFTITCDMEGNPDPMWGIRKLKRNQTVNVFYRGSKAGLITIANLTATCDSSGTYNCMGFNNLNLEGNASAEQVIKVPCSPRQDPRMISEKSKRAGLQGNVVFTQHVIGYPYATFNWSRDDGQPMGNVGPEYGKDYAKLYVYTIRISDFGNYTLTASNEHGNLKTIFTLVPHGSPPIPTNLTVTNVTDHSVSLSWISGYDMGNQLFFYIYKYNKMYNTWSLTEDTTTSDSYANHGIGQIWNYTLTKGIEPGTAFSYGVTAMSGGYETSYSNVASGKTTGTPPAQAAASSSALDVWVLLLVAVTGLLL